MLYRHPLEWRALNFFRVVSDAEWEEYKRRGRQRYIWRAHVLPFGLPIGMLIAIQRYVELGISWRDLPSLKGVAIAYVSITLSMLISAGWGLLAWHHRSETDKEKEP
jgi:hypothetical protein